jgi:hypothetical protein
MALRLCTALWWFWLWMSHWNEGWSFLEQVLAGSKEVAVPVRAKALWSAGNLASQQGYFEWGEVLCQESLTLFREIGDAARMAHAVFHLVIVAGSRCDLAAARSRYEECLVLTGEAGDKNLFAWVLLCLAEVAFTQDEYARARPRAEESLALFREVGDKTGIVISLCRFPISLRLVHGYASENSATKERFSTYLSAPQSQLL